MIIPKWKTVFSGSRKKNGDGRFSAPGRSQETSSGTNHTWASSTQHWDRLYGLRRSREKSAGLEKNFGRLGANLRSVPDHVDIHSELLTSGLYTGWSFEWILAVLRLYDQSYGDEDPLFCSQSVTLPKLLSESILLQS